MKSTVVIAAIIHRSHSECIYYVDIKIAKTEQVQKRKLDIEKEERNNEAHYMKIMKVKKEKLCTNKKVRMKQKYSYRKQEKSR